MHDRPDIKPPRPGVAAKDADIMALMELFFFAYRDFIADPDAMLAEIGFGRAHHRVVHFIGRHPGLKVSELLAILRITKQSLGRVLRELIDEGYVCQREGRADRRQRLLYLTDKGEALHAKLAAPQIARFRRAFAATGEEARAAFARVLMEIVSEDHRPAVQALIGDTDTPDAAE